MIIQYVHVDSLSAATREGTGIVLLLNEASDTSNNHGTREDGLDIASWHLKNNTHVGGNGNDQTRSSLHATTSLVILWIILGNLKIYI